MIRKDVYIENIEEGEERMATDLVRILADSLEAQGLRS